MRGGNQRSKGMLSGNAPQQSKCYSETYHLTSKRAVVVGLPRGVTKAIPLVILKAPLASSLSPATAKLTSDFSVPLSNVTLAIPPSSFTVIDDVSCMLSGLATISISPTLVSTSTPPNFGLRSCPLPAIAPLANKAINSTTDAAPRLKVLRIIRISFLGEMQ